MYTLIFIYVGICKHAHMHTQRGIVEQGRLLTLLNGEIQIKLDPPDS